MAVSKPSQRSKVFGVKGEWSNMETYWSFKTFSKVKGVWGQAAHGSKTPLTGFKTFSKVKGVWGSSKIEALQIMIAFQNLLKGQRCLGPTLRAGMMSCYQRFKTFSKVKGVWGNICDLCCKDFEVVSKPSQRSKVFGDVLWLL